MAAYRETGYEDERFEQPVSLTLHCVICTNVLKDPVMCHNEHLYCRACIAIHLMNNQTCPSCREPLTIDTVSQAPRSIRDLLSELKIRCDFSSRGCERFIEVGDLERHVRECGYAPVVCSNEGCQLEVNKYDLLHHETAVCEQRIVKCHSCNNIMQDMDTLKVNLVSTKEKLDRNDKKLDRNDKNAETSSKEVLARIKLVQEQLNKQEEANRRLEMETKKSLTEMAKQLERITQHQSHNAQTEQEQIKKGIAEASEAVDCREPKIVVAGGGNVNELNSVEIFSPSSGKWSPLQPMKERRQAASSIVFDSQTIFVMGGRSNRLPTSSMEKLLKRADQINESVSSLSWETLRAELPSLLWGHSCVIHNRRLIAIGGYDGRKQAYSDSITEIDLFPPFTLKQLAQMPQRRCFHGVALIDDKIVILGGREKGSEARTNLQTVFSYDITKNQCKELMALPYPVSDMATVKWSDDTIVLLGGVDKNNAELDKVILYNVKTQRSYMLPEMNHKRRGCVAGVVANNLIVMGGKNRRENCLKSVESFSFDHYMWEELPEMHEARYQPTAVVW